MSARLFTLTRLHQKIDERLHLARQRPAPDSLELTRLKKMKLRVKDLIQRLARSAPQADHTTRRPSAG
ncbi:DUF465 domain-containing protein [Altererythrobacter buctensis]|uniref:DUF465 domain-containing protein n=1 Tax=Alteraurantiacibacter buctensis TaxID=1503981 RepID=A0A844YTA3_9SPHN|nr:DUF465 domain-containing protein [Alteraurantiacibacter buctensis]